MTELSIVLTSQSFVPSPDGSLAVTTGEHPFLVRVADGTDIPVATSEFAHSTEFSGDGTRLALATDSDVLVVDTATGQIAAVVQASSLVDTAGQMDLLEPERSEKWRKALGAVDRLRDKFGERTVTLASGMGGEFRERTHEAMPMRPKDRPDNE